MILETAEITVKRGFEERFEEGVVQAAPLFQRARGCRGLSLHRVIEQPSVYRLLVKWDRIEDHLAGFRDSTDFSEWRKLVGDCFEKPPAVTHTRMVVPFE